MLQSGYLPYVVD